MIPMLKGDLRKQAILDVAGPLFFEKGYAAATIQDMLDLLHCSKGSFYHHYESKLQVLASLCRQQAEAAFERYQQQVYEDALARLNGLIYYAMPFRAGEEKTIALLLPLEGLADGSVVRQAILDAQKELFFPAICDALELLRVAGKVYFANPLLPEILWDTYTILYQRMMAEAAGMMNGGSTGGIIQLIDTERFIWERLLDAPYGSIELVRGDEALQAIGHAIARLRRQSTQGA